MKTASQIRGLCGGETAAGRFPVRREEQTNTTQKKGGIIYPRLGAEGRGELVARHFTRGISRESMM